ATVSDLVLHEDDTVDIRGPPEPDFRRADGVQGACSGSSDRSAFMARIAAECCSSKTYQKAWCQLSSVERSVAWAPML
ncbi:MAG: hypothetical protein ACI88C_001614, partial [Acidimicrobiales bacterium]